MKNWHVTLLFRVILAVFGSCLGRGQSDLEFRSVCEFSATSSQSYTVFKKSESPFTKGCQNISASEYVCTGSDVLHLPKASDFPPVLEILRINRTRIRYLTSKSFANVTITRIYIDDNSELQLIEADTFQDVRGLKELVFRNNINLGLSSIPSFREDFFRPFYPLVGLHYLVIDNSNLDLRGIVSSAQKPERRRLCIYLLDFSRNALNEIGPNFFRAFDEGSVNSLILQSSKLSFIHHDAFLWITDLKELDLSSNEELFDKTDVSRPMKHLRNLENLRLDDNYLSDVPFNIIKSVNSSLQLLNLSLNIFNRLDENSFPNMSQLKVLYLDACRIKSFDEKTFVNMPKLEYLSLQWNFLSQVPHLTFSDSLRKLHFEAIEDQTLVLEDNTFEGFAYLEELTLKRLSLGKLTFQKLRGLDNLSILNLESSFIEEIENETFRAVPSLKKLFMGYCEGLKQIPIAALIGPCALEVLDLSYIQIFQDNSTNFVNKDMSSALDHTKVLNLTGSLKNVEFPLDRLSLDLMPDLEELNIGENAITFWDSVKFTSNRKLKRFIMNRNDDVISLTPAMIEDFKQMKYVDLSDNKFDCNENIVEFYRFFEVEPHGNDDPILVDWQNGEGYFCRDEKNEKMSFKEFVFKGEDIDPGFPGSQDDSGSALPMPVLVSIVIGCCVVAGLVGFASYSIHSRWWYFQYLFTRYWALKPRKRLISDPFVYDAFVSYSSDDEPWVYTYLVTNLEERGNPMKLCLHQRDFKIGRSITENIVASIEESRACVLVLSASFVKSSWCKFEAQVAHQLFQEQNRASRLVVVVPSEIPTQGLDRTLRSILKTRTYLDWQDNAQFWTRLKLAISDDDSECSSVSVVSDPSTIQHEDFRR